MYHGRRDSGERCGAIRTIARWNLWSLITSGRELVPVNLWKTLTRTGNFPPPGEVKQKRKCCAHPTFRATFRVRANETKTETHGLARGSRWVPAFGATEGRKAMIDTVILFLGPRRVSFKGSLESAGSQLVSECAALLWVISAGTSQPLVLASVNPCVSDVRALVYDRQVAQFSDADTEGQVCHSGSKVGVRLRGLHLGLLVVFWITCEPCVPYFSPDQMSLHPNLFSGFWLAVHGQIARACQVGFAWYSGREISVADQLRLRND